MEGDHLVINGTNYGIEDIHKLPPALAGYLATQKEDENTIAFMGELNPYSNFHHSKFKINNHTYHSSEQWIQFQKAMLFGDSFTANQILSCNTPLEAKQLGYDVNGFDAKKWPKDGYSICLDGIKEKFIQNPPLLQMLKSTSPKLIVEASMDKQWGTGVHLHSVNALKRESWNGNSWMSQMLNEIRSENIPSPNESP